MADIAQQMPRGAILANLCLRCALDYINIYINFIIYYTTASQQTPSHPPMIKQQQPTQVVELQPLNSAPEQAKQHQSAAVPEVQNPRPCLWFILSWLLFLLALGVYGAIWAISRYAVTVQASQYYTNAYPVSPYIEVDPTLSACNSTVNRAAQTSTSLHSSTDLTTATAVALSLVFSWLEWKLPFAMFMLHLIYDTLNSRIVKYVTWAIAVALMLAADILLLIFIPTIYQEYMFYAFTALLTIVVTLINNRPFILNSFLSSFLPYFFIAVLYFFYSYLIPSIFNQVIKNINPGYEYVMIYGYPILDLILYSCLLALNSSIRLHYAKPLLSFVQFYLIGYFAGITMLASVTEVEFYYLVAYLLFRNFFTNWVMWRWEGVVNNPPCLPGWGIVYYLSYIFNFLPVIGMGPLVLSKSFHSQQFSQSCLLLYYYPNTQYPYNTLTPSPRGSDGSYSYNYQLTGFIFWPAALIIWAISTFTQQYPRRKPTLFDFFYNLLGIYMFYLGISGGLQLLTLRQVGIF